MENKKISKLKYLMTGLSNYELFVLMKKSAELALTSVIKEPEIHWSHTHTNSLTKNEYLELKSDFDKDVKYLMNSYLFSFSDNGNEANQHYYKDLVRAIRLTDCPYVKQFPKEVFEEVFKLLTKYILGHSEALRANIFYRKFGSLLSSSEGYFDERERRGRVYKIYAMRNLVKFLNKVIKELKTI